MCIIANLMGPSTAVLMIPTLQWRETRKVPTQHFEELLSHRSPSDTGIPSCNPTELEMQNYTCAQRHHRNDLDSLIATYAVEGNKFIDEANSTNYLISLANSPVSFEGIVPFTFNTSIDITSPQQNLSTTIWSLSRQALRSLSRDLEGLAHVIQGEVTEDPTYTKRYAPSNNSYSLHLQRRAPMIGLHGYYSSGSLTTVTSHDERVISCYSDSATNQAECFRTGRGWNGREAAASFEITDGETNDTGPVNVRFYWSDRSTNCNVDPSPGRDLYNYETLFDHCVGDLEEDCANSFVVEVSRPKSTNPEQVIFMEFSLSWDIGTYSLDATTVFPSLPVVEVRERSHLKSNASMMLDPAWALAAWGLSSGDKVAGTGAAAQILQVSTNRFLNKYATWTRGDGLPDPDGNNVVGAILYTMLQAASLVEYSFTPADSQKTLSQNDDGRTLWTNLRRQIWGWGVDDRRTATLGIIVGILGCLTVLVRTVALIKTHELEPSSTELIAAALQHKHTGEFDLEDGKSKLAHVRYQILEEEPFGRQFRPVLGYS